ncbi:TIGR01841 family phasin [Burkholderia stagnalis]|uniref:Phasin (PHA-granule associated protein) n=1 Tax=Burkholderia stagnalis TaxID=1503054 RepID=A0A108GWQ7_9BURK|nr:TIGR01841 family phasin [Burkholderia stagnalis]KVO55626.1 Phasin (PHA-granule associated protein) [Burkholderia stagnalis]KVP13356.1 Phasin (PHA-granule associated protein) [Burkholderia stagnalis]KVW97460.1 Phasin (PHA-granule associated protein) [Burkholderia stagnalis]KVZ11754.1 Phasin (PHA-granule associated protein) [Burkholderia stagnalis]KWA54989.1 Phasin (PHA-granule associated protein) [Burkholderia stagnalis]
MKTQELVSSAQRANLDVVFGLAGTMLEGVGKLAELNAQFTRSTLNDAWAVAQNAVEKPQDWLAFQGSIAAPMAEKLQSYTREFLGIVSSSQAEVLKVAQTGGDAYVHRIQAFVEDAARNAPSGPEAAVAAWNSAIVAANTLYQTLGNTGQQAVEVARSNFDVAVAAASKSARRGLEQEQQAAKR